MAACGAPDEQLDYRPPSAITVKNHVNTSSYIWPGWSYLGKEYHSPIYLQYGPTYEPIIKQ